MAAIQKKRITPDEYLEQDRNAEEKSEFIDGEIIAMSGASAVHEALISNLQGELRNKLRRGSCRVYGSNLRVQISETGSYVYPDISVVCGQIRLVDHRGDVLLNPKVVFEILSPSTEAIDRGRKFENYRRLESLTDYVLVAQDRMMVEHFRRHEGLWVLSEASAPEDELRLESIDCAIPLSDIYEGVFAPEDAPSEAA